MNISINAHSIELTAPLKEYVEKRLGGLGKFTGSDPMVVVDLQKTTEHHRQGEIFEAKVVVTTPLGKVHHAASQKADLYEAIDDIRSELIRELSSAKEKKATLFKRGAQRVKNMLRGFRS